MPTDDTKTSVEELIYSYYVKYNVLKPMIDSVYSEYRSDVVNVYIDLYDCIRALYGREIYSKTKFAIVSCVINMIAHYRHFFRSRYNVYANVLLIYADESSMNHKQFLPTFKHYNYDETVNYNSTDSYIQNQLELIKILCAYISNAYFIRKKCNFAVYAYDDIVNHPRTPCIVITKNDYSYQIPAMCANAIVVRPKKSFNQDSSYLICKDNVLLQYFSNINNATHLKQIMSLDSELLSVIMSIAGLPDYGVYRICNSIKAIHMLIEAITDNRILNGYNNDINYVYDNLNGLSAYIDKTNFRFRFSALDLVFQHRIYINTPEAMDNTWFINLYDIESVQDINNKYFIDDPLRLEEL